MAETGFHKHILQIKKSQKCLNCEIQTQNSDFLSRNSRFTSCIVKYKLWNITSELQGKKSEL